MWQLYQDAEQQTSGLENSELQKLDGEIIQAEGKESQKQEVLKAIAEYQRLAVTRKVRYRNICQTQSAELRDSQRDAGLSDAVDATGSMQEGQPLTSCPLLCF